MSKSYLAKGTFWILSGMLFQLFMGYVNTIFILRYVDIAVYGVIIFLVSITDIAATFSKQGMPVAATKFIAEYVGKREQQKAKIIFNELRWYIALAAGALIAVSPFIYKFLLPQKITVNMSYFLYAMFFIAFVLFSALLALTQYGFTGLKDTFLSSVTGYIMQPLFRIICIVSILSLLPTITGLVYVYVIPLTAAYLISELLMKKKSTASLCRLLRTQNYCTAFRSL
jgi:O-antigen/teichoic acid export membrane protein